MGGPPAFSNLVTQIALAAGYETPASPFKKHFQASPRTFA